MRPRTGTVVKTKLGLWQAVVTLPDGTRKRLSPCVSQEDARELARKVSTAKGGRPRTGTVLQRAGKYYARVRNGEGRTSIALPDGIDLEEAKRIALQLAQGVEVAPQADPFKSTPIQPGARFGRWTVLEASSDKRVAAICECGYRARLLCDELRRRKTLQCRQCRAQMAKDVRAAFESACERAMRSGKAVQFRAGEAAGLVPKGHQDYAVIGGVFLSASDLADLFAMTGRRLRAQVANLAKKIATE